MGTNYYLQADTCPACNHSAEVLHIGKSSAGWVFLLRLHKETDSVGPIASLEDWKLLFDKHLIKNEYGEVVSKKEMLSVITERPPFNGKPLCGNHHGRHNNPGYSFRAKTSGQPAPNPEDTWEYFDSDYS